MSDNQFKKAEDYTPDDTPFVDVRTEPVPVKVKDEFDKKLDHFQYENVSSYEWEQQNPLNVPREIKEAYPQFTFRYRAIDHRTQTLWRGKDYHGWQVFTDSKNPEGIKVGGDLVLCAMPNERAESYRKYVANLSTDQVRAMQESSLEAVDRAGSELRAKGVDFKAFNPGSQVTGRTGGKSAPVGISVGAERDRKTGEPTSQHRGYPPEELQEMAAKAQEERDKNRTTRSYSVKRGG